MKKYIVKRNFFKSGLKKEGDIIMLSDMDAKSLSSFFVEPVEDELNKEVEKTIDVIEKPLEVVKETEEVKETVVVDKKPKRKIKK